MKSALRQLVLSIGIVIALASIASAERDWTSVASAGAVDSASLEVFETAGTQIRVNATASLPAALVVRYNVVALNSVTFGSGLGMAFRFRDNGAGARVQAVLKQVSLVTGVTTTVLTLDSNTFPSAPNFQTQGLDVCPLGLLDFEDNAYFIEATLSKATAAASPALQVLRLSSLLCFE